MNSRHKILQQVKNDRAFRITLTSQSFEWFFATYFSHYITCTTADFQKEIMSLLQNQEIPKVVITAFRGSAKSTLATLAYPIWAMVGLPRKKYILLISQTQELAKQILTNMKQEFSSNDLLIKDYGPFAEVADEWRANSLVNSNYNTRITAVSQSEGTRGLRHRQYRPDLIIIDDVENLESVKTMESRDRLWNWLMGEIVLIGDVERRMIVVGNLLHEDSLMMRLKDNINSEKLDGVYREYPLIDDKGEVLWKGKYPSQKDIENKRKNISDNSAWYREYLLKIISDDKRIVQRDWIQRYGELPNQQLFPPRIFCVGTDLAISQRLTADYTSMVPLYVTGFGEDLKIYVLPYIINKRLNFTDTIKEVKKLVKNLKESFGRLPIVYVEGVSYQNALVQQLTIEKVLAESINISGMNKQTRLELTTPYIRLGKVLFPKKGSEVLESQIVNFGIEKHDDLVDAFTLPLLKVLGSDRPIYKSKQIESRPPTPIYRDFGTGRVNVSKPFFNLNMKF